MYFALEYRIFFSLFLSLSNNFVTRSHSLKNRPKSRVISWLIASSSRFSTPWKKRSSTNPLLPMYRKNRRKPNRVYGITSLLIADRLEGMQWWRNIYIFFSVVARDLSLSCSVCNDEKENLEEMTHILDLSLMLLFSIDFRVSCSSDWNKSFSKQANNSSNRRSSFSSSYRIFRRRTFTSFDIRNIRCHHWDKGSRCRCCCCCCRRCCGTLLCNYIGSHDFQTNFSIEWSHRTFMVIIISNTERKSSSLI